MAEALQHIHSRGYLHNDLKANNVVLEMRCGSQYNPVIIDFGMSTRINARKPKKCLSPADQRMYRQTYPHITQEIVNGKGTSSTTSDVYLFTNLIEFVCLKAELNLVAQRVLLKNLGLSEMPDKRPKLHEFILN